MIDHSQQRSDIKRRRNAVSDQASSKQVYSSKTFRPQDLRRIVGWIQNSDPKMDDAVDVRPWANAHANCQTPVGTGRPANGETDPAPGRQPKLNSSPKTAAILHIQRHRSAPSHFGRRSSNRDLPLERETSRAKTVIEYSG